MLGINWWLCPLKAELKTKNSTKRQLCCLLVEFCVFNSIYYKKNLITLSRVTFTQHLCDPAFLLFILLRREWQEVAAHQHWRHRASAYGVLGWLSRSLRVTSTLKKKNDYPFGIWTRIKVTLVRVINFSCKLSYVPLGLRQTQLLINTGSIIINWRLLWWCLDDIIT